MKNLENRWFTKNGKAKRIPKTLEPFREFAGIAWNENLNSIQMTAALRIKYNLGLADAANLMVYIVGCYSNAAQYGHGHANGSLFTSERYAQGSIVAKNINEPAFNIRTLELVK